MNPILRKTVFWHLCHLATFSVVTLPIAFDTGRIPYPVLILAPLWLTSAVLNLEREEAYGFLRTLPVTDRRIVRIKLGAALAATLLYWLLTTTLAVSAWGGSEQLPLFLTLGSLACAFGLVLVAVWYAAIYLWGISVMTPVLVGYMILNFLVSLVMALTYRGWGHRQDLRFPVIGLVAGAPWYLHAVLYALVLLAFWGLMRLAGHVKASSEAHL